MSATAHAARSSKERSPGSNARPSRTTTPATTRSSSAKSSRRTSAARAKASFTAGASSARRDLGRWCPLRLPVAVERGLNLDEPHDRTDQRQDEPQPGDAADGARLSVEVLVHVAHLRRDDEERDR